MLNNTIERLRTMKMSAFADELEVSVQCVFPFSVESGIMESLASRWTVLDHLRLSKLVQWTKLE